MPPGRPTAIGAKLTRRVDGRPTIAVELGGGVPRADLDYDDPVSPEVRIRGQAGAVLGFWRPADAGDTMYILS